VQEVVNNDEEMADKIIETEQDEEPAADQKEAGLFGRLSNKNKIANSKKIWRAQQNIAAKRKNKLLQKMRTDCFENDKVANDDAKLGYESSLTSMQRAIEVMKQNE